MIKSEIKAAVIHDIGASLDDDREKAAADFQQMAGGADALRKCAKAVNELKKHVDKDIDAETLQYVFDGPLAFGEYLKRWIDKASGCAISMSEYYESQKLRREGSLNAYDAIINMLGKQHSVAAAKAMRAHEVEQMQRDGLMEDSDMPRPNGTRPGPGIKSQRIVEVKEPPAESQPTEAPEPAIEEPEPQAEEPPRAGAVSRKKKRSSKRSRA